MIALLLAVGLAATGADDTRMVYKDKLVRADQGANTALQVSYSWAAAGCEDSKDRDLAKTFRQAEVTDDGARWAIRFETRPEPGEAGVLCLRYVFEVGQEARRGIDHDLTQVLSEISGAVRRGAEREGGDFRGQVKASVIAAVQESAALKRLGRFASSTGQRIDRRLLGELGLADCGEAACVPGERFWQAVQDTSNMGSRLRLFTEEGAQELWQAFRAAGRPAGTVCDGATRGAWQEPGVERWREAMVACTAEVLTTARAHGATDLATSRPRLVENLGRLREGGQPSFDAVVDVYNFLGDDVYDMLPEAEEDPTALLGALLAAERLAREAALLSWQSRLLGLVPDVESWVQDVEVSLAREAAVNARAPSPFGVATGVVYVPALDAYQIVTTASVCAFRGCYLEGESVFTGYDSMPWGPDRKGPGAGAVMRHLVRSFSFDLGARIGVLGKPELRDPRDTGDIGLLTGFGWTPVSVIRVSAGWYHFQDQLEGGWRHPSYVGITFSLDDAAQLMGLFSPKKSLMSVTSSGEEQP